jgi:anti-sigma factor RsiW
MALENQRLSPDERADLVAYLDGELEEPGRSAIATKLAHSATARRELDALKRTWEMLDHLPRIEASEELGTRTITEALQLVTHEDRIAGTAGLWVRRIKRASVLVLAFVGAFAAGFILMRHVWPNPTAELARKLSIAEHLEEYRSVGSFEFLEILEHAPPF